MGKQMQMPGTERPTNAEVDAAAEAYQEQKNKRIKLSKKEKELKGALIGVMKKHNLTSYRDDTASPPLYVTLIAKDDVSVDEVDAEVSDDAIDEGGDEGGSEDGEASTDAAN